MNKAIKPYSQNAKKHPDKQLKQIAASIERFGFRQPIVIDKDGTIIVGHGRYEAAAKILEWTELREAPEAKKGEKVIPYIIADDLTEDEIRAYRLADNKLNESEWDYEILDMEFELLSVDLKELAGFGDDNSNIDINDLDREHKQNPYQIICTLQTLEDLENAKVEIEGILERYKKSYLSIKGGEF